MTYTINFFLLFLRVLCASVVILLRIFFVTLDPDKSSKQL